MTPGEAMGAAGDMLRADLTALEHELQCERRRESITAKRRAHIHMMWLSAGGAASLVLYLLHLDVASIGATGVAPILAEATVLLRRLG